MKKIDFLEELKGMGFVPVVPRGVLQEMKDLKKRGKTSHNERMVIDLALELIEKEKVKKARLGGKNVDEGLIAKGKEGIHIATLDNGIKREITNKVIIENSRRGLKVVRG